MLQAVRNAFNIPDLRRKLMFTFLILAIYRLAAHVPVPNVDPVALRQFFERSHLLRFLDMFSGGAMSNFSVMALGVYPYITASIIIQLLMPLFPQLEALAEEGDAGRQKISQYTHYLAIPLAMLQGFGQATILQRQGVITQFGLAPATLLPTLSTLATLTAGTMFAIWLGELIDRDGIGNGISIIIFGGIVSRVPQRMGQMLVTDVGGLIMFLIIMVITVAVIVFVQEGERRVPVQYGKRVVGMRGRQLQVRGGQSTHIPLKVNSAGMIPLIFAQSIMIFPGVIASYLRLSSVGWVSQTADGIYRLFNSKGNFYWIMYFLMVVGFTYFYTDVMFQQQNLSENLRRQGGFIPGIRPGRRTSSYLNGILQRITLVGAVFLGGVAILPGLVRGVSETSTMLITSSGLIIVVGVVLDTMRSLEAQLLMRRYEGFIR
ncbi:MAG: preprotein translocase subunit SecY [Chloroflexota bacterium]|nr:preprotein translocase subunit SecY [Chloroflexota bacterium]